MLIIIFSISILYYDLYVTRHLQVQHAPALFLPPHRHCPEGARPRRSSMPSLSLSLSLSISRSLSLSIYIFIYIYISMCMCMYIYIYMHMHALACT